MVGWQHQLNGCGFEYILEDSEGQGSLVCYSSWSCKELGTAEGLNNNSMQKSKGKRPWPKDNDAVEINPIFTSSRKNGVVSWRSM